MRNAKEVSAPDKSAENNRKFAFARDEAETQVGQQEERIPGRNERAEEQELRRGEEEKEMTSGKQKAAQNIKSQILPKGEEYRPSTCKTNNWGARNSDIIIQRPTREARARARHPARRQKKDESQ